jgi:hypothetical protein
MIPAMSIGLPWEKSKGTTPYAWLVITLLLHFGEDVRRVVRRHGRARVVRRRQRVAARLQLDQRLELHAVLLRQHLLDLRGRLDSSSARLHDVAAVQAQGDKRRCASCLGHRSRHAGRASRPACIPARLPDATRTALSLATASKNGLMTSIFAMTAASSSADNAAGRTGELPNAFCAAWSHDPASPGSARAQGRSGSAPRSRTHD